MTPGCAVRREVLVARASHAAPATVVRRDACVVGVDVHRRRRRPQPDLLLDESPRHRVQPPVEGDVTVLVDARLVPDDELVAPRWDRLESHTFLGEEIDRSSMRRAVHATVRDLVHPSLQLAPRVVDVGTVAPLEEVPLDVLDARLDLPLLLRRVDRCGVDLDLVVACELAVAAIQARRTVDAEGRAYDR